jgi:Fe-S-cluster containining protein
VAVFSTERAVIPPGDEPMPRRVHPLHHRPTVPRQHLPPGTSLCDHCTAKCCRYFSLPIKTPRTWDDYDEIRWFLAHGQTIVYVEDQTWYLLVMARCRYLTAEGRCGIYHTRPKICEEYTTDSCEYDSDWSFDRVFEAPEQVEEFAEAILPPRRSRRPPRPAPPPSLVVLNPPLPRSGR